VRIAYDTHARLRAVAADPDGPVPAHYFDDDPTVGSDPVDVDVSLPGCAFSLTTDRGVFSRGRLDPGTSLLLRAPLPVPAHGNLLDLGCGAGPIALALAQRSPEATIWAVDVNARARGLATANARRNDLGNVVVAAPDHVPRDLAFDSMWSNPPIRIGKPALHALLTDWLDRLVEGGTVALVVQKHLGADSLQRWLAESGHPLRRVAAKSGYRVLAT
jgi:16S rRNA (guanine1207-N2)-methyltransferase